MRVRVCVRACVCPRAARKERKSVPPSRSLLFSLSLFHHTRVPPPHLPRALKTHTHTLHSTAMVKISVLGDALKTLSNAEKRGKRQVLLRPSSKVVIKFLQVMQKKVRARSGDDAIGGLPASPPVERRGRGRAPGVAARGRRGESNGRAIARRRRPTPPALLSLLPRAGRLRASVPVEPVPVCLALIPGAKAWPRCRVRGDSGRTLSSLPLSARRRQAP